MRLGGFLLFFFALAAEAAPARYLLADARVLRTNIGVFTAVALAPSRYYLSDDYTPSRWGKVLENASRDLAVEASDLILEEFEAFYAPYPKGLDHLRKVVAPTLRHGRIQDGRSITLLLFHDGWLIGTLKGAWRTSDAPLYPFEGAPHEQRESLVLDDSPFREGRELKHLAVRARGDYDTAQMLLRFSASLGIVGTRVEFVSRDGKYVQRSVEANRYYAHTELRAIALYYQRRAHFRIEPELSRRHGGYVLSASAEDPAFQSGLVPATLGRTPVLELSTESIDAAQLYHAIHVRHWSEHELLDALRNGTFRAPDERENCAALFTRSGMRPRRFSPSYPGSINP